MFELGWGFAISVMANQPTERRLAVYRSESAFALAWGVLPEEAQAKLSHRGLHDPSIWNALLEGMPTAVLLSEFASGLCGPLTESGIVRWSELGNDLVLLGQASEAAAKARESGIAQLSDLAMIVESAERNRANRGVVTAQDLKRLEAESLAFVPKAWLGREVRRPELLDSSWVASAPQLRRSFAPSGPKRWQASWLRPSCPLHAKPATCREKR